MVVLDIGGTLAGFLRVPVLRGRFAATAGRLSLGEEPALELELDAGSLRTNVPGLARALTNEGGLCASAFPALHFSSTWLELTGARDVELVGRLDVLGVSRELRLSGKLTYADELAVTLWLKGVLPPPRRRPARGYWIAQVIGDRPLHVELAAEFVQ
ncbi:YceI family protein [Amycolatopsis pithecellobii]|uniref:YceI family protein n=1 Tax=Amycolatopsis pithecellobii TaxID=664692 RepID=UPI00140A8F64|nr:YceI family protein [Amycolatopsis pithecellobii]